MLLQYAEGMVESIQCKSQFLSSRYVETSLRIDVNGWGSTSGFEETGLPESRESEKKGMKSEHVG